MFTTKAFGDSCKMVVMSKIVVWTVGNRIGLEMWLVCNGVEGCVSLYFVYCPKCMCSYNAHCWLSFSLCIVSAVVFAYEYIILEQKASEWNTSNTQKEHVSQSLIWKCDSLKDPLSVLLFLLHFFSLTHPSSSPSFSSSPLVLPCPPSSSLPLSLSFHFLPSLSLLPCSSVPPSLPLSHLPLLQLPSQKTWVCHSAGVSTSSGHGNHLALHCVSLSKILLTWKQRIKVNGSVIMDILNFDNPAAQTHSVTIYQVQCSECVHYTVCMIKHLELGLNHLRIRFKYWDKFP